MCEQTSERCKRTNERVAQYCTSGFLVILDHSPPFSPLPNHIHLSIAPLPCLPFLPLILLLLARLVLPLSTVGRAFDGSLREFGPPTPLLLLLLLLLLLIPLFLLSCRPSVARFTGCFGNSVPVRFSSCQQVQASGIYQCLFISCIKN